MTEDAARGRHQLRTLVLAGAVLLVVLLAVVVAAIGADWLNRYWFLNFPLGFYLPAQGLLILIVVAGFWFVRTQERIDRARSESEEL